MKKILMSLAFCTMVAVSYSQDSMNKKMENKTDNMNKKMDNPSDKMNKKMQSPADTARVPMDTVSRKGRARTSKMKKTV